MGEIINHRNLPLFAPNFLPPLYPFKGFQGTGDDLQSKVSRAPAMICSGIFSWSAIAITASASSRLCSPKSLVLKAAKVSLFFMMSKVVQGDAKEMGPKRQAELVFFP
jgi:hypothetical protein